MQIHVARGEQQLGVYSPEAVRNMLTSGELLPTDYGWAEGQSAWTPLSAFPGLEAGAPQPSPAASPGIPLQPRASVQPRSAASPFPATTAAQASGPKADSGLAIASLVCGILGISFVPFLAAIPAVICGHVARSEINKSGGRLGGAGMALAGLITGYLGLVMLPVIIALLAAIAFPVFKSVQAKGLETKALSNAKQIGTACRLYAVDKNGAFPKTLDELVPEYLPDRELFVCPFDKSRDPMGYEYYGGKDTDPADNVLLVSKALSEGKRRVVINVDTSGRVVRDMPELPPHRR